MIKINISEYWKEHCPNIFLFDGGFKTQIFQRMYELIRGFVIRKFCGFRKPISPRYYSQIAKNVTNFTAFLNVRNKFVSCVMTFLRKSHTTTSAEIAQVDLRLSYVPSVYRAQVLSVMTVFLFPSSAFVVCKLPFSSTLKFQGEIWDALFHRKEHFN